MLTYFGMEAGDEDEAPWLDDYVAKMGKDDKTMRETHQTLMHEKLFSFPMTKFALQEQQIGEEEFFKLPAPGAAHHHQH